jgi:hypothetical protein
MLLPFSFEEKGLGDEVKRSWRNFDVLQVRLGGGGVLIMKTPTGFGTLSGLVVFLLCLMLY